MRSTAGLLLLLLLLLLVALLAFGFRGSRAWRHADTEPHLCQ
jgi:hypothetical protein